MPAKRDNKRINAILDDLGDLEFLSAEASGQASASGLRVDYIPAQLIRPDPAQPRRVLPERIYWDFHNTHFTPAQALREFIQLVQITARQQGRPFGGVLDLLPNPDDEREEETPTLSPEEQLLTDLLNLAVTIRDDGQVNPLTVVDCSQGVTQLYRIETGERRYWAMWLLMDFLPGYQGDGTIPCIIIPSDQASVFRQAKENTSRAGLNAIALARQAALLVLAAHDIHPPDGPVSNDFYRQALELDLRGKREYSAEILAAMGGISRAYFSRLKALIGFSDEAIELADRHNLDEARLRYVLTLPVEHHGEMVRQIIDFGLTRKQVKEVCEQEEAFADKTGQTFSSSIRRLGRLLTTDETFVPDDLLDFLTERNADRYLTRARIQKLKQLLDDVERSLGEG